MDTVKVLAVGLLAVVLSTILIAILLWSMQLIHALEG